MENFVSFITEHNAVIVTSNILFGICLVVTGFCMKMYSPKCTDERKMFQLINISDYLKGIGILFVSVGALCRIYQTNPELFESIFSII